MAASEIRALFAVATRPEIVLLAGGVPCVTALPLDVVGDMTGQVVAGRGARSSTALRGATRRSVGESAR
jgi:hypothetical protein